MKQAEAAALVAKLFAAYPFHRDNDELTAAVYVEQVARLEDPHVALDAVNELIASSRYLPPIADLNDAYYTALSVREERARNEHLALPEGKGSEEERQENLRRAQEFLDKFARSSRMSA